MNILLRKGLAGLLVAMLLGGSALAQGRIATIDLNKAFSNYWKKKEAEANLKDLEADMMKELKAMETDFNSAKSTYQKLLNDSNDQAVSVEEREKRKKMAEDKLKEAKDLDERAGAYKRQASTRLEEQANRVRQSIFKEIQNVVSAKAKAAGYSLVLDTAAQSANGAPVVLYNNNEFDITDSVLDQLNAAAPTASASSGSGKADENKKESKKGSK